MVLQPEEPKISLSGIDHFARSAAEFESQEGVTLFPELRIVSTITREVETDAESEVAEGTDDDPTGIYDPDMTLHYHWKRYQWICIHCYIHYFILSVVFILFELFIQTFHSEMVLCFLRLCKTLSNFLSH